MKIIIINQHPEDVLGGSEIQCDLIAEYMSKLGNEVLYLAINGQKQEYNVEYNIKPFKFSYLSLYKIIKQQQPDVVYWRYDKKKLLVSTIILNALECPIVFGVSSRENVQKWMSYQHKDYSTLRSIINTVVLSSFRPIIRIINHIGFKFVDGATVLNSNLKNRIGVSKEEVIYDSMEHSLVPFHRDRDFIIWVANLKPGKNPEKVIELAEDISTDIIMVGEVQNNRYNYIKNPDNLPKNLHYLGSKSVEEVNGMIQESLFLIHTCDPEGFGDVFIQAWNSGKPTVSLYFDPDNLIESNQVGMVSGNMASFRKDVENLATNKDLRIKLGREAERLASEKFDPQSNIKKLENMFISILRNSKNN